MRLLDCCATPQRPPRGVVPCACINTNSQQLGSPREDTASCPNEVSRREPTAQGDKGLVDPRQGAKDAQGAAGPTDPNNGTITFAGLGVNKKCLFSLSLNLNHLCPKKTASRNSALNCASQFVASQIGGPRGKGGGGECLPSPQEKQQRCHLLAIEVGMRLWLAGKNRLMTIVHSWAHGIRIEQLSD